MSDFKQGWSEYTDIDKVKPPYPFQASSTHYLYILIFIMLRSSEYCGVRGELSIASPITLR